MHNTKKIIFSILLFITTLDLSAQDHVTLKNGEVLDGKIEETKMSTTIGDMARIKVNGETYKVNKVRSYQKGNNYVVNIDDRYFTKAYIHGNINAVNVQESYRDFTKMSTTGSMEVGKDYHMIQKGEDGKLVILSYKNLEEMINDNPEVLAKFNSVEKNGKGSPYSKKEKEFLATTNEIIQMYNKK